MHHSTMPHSAGSHLGVGADGGLYSRLVVSGHEGGCDVHLAGKELTQRECASCIVSTAKHISGSIQSGRSGAFAMYNCSTCTSSVHRTACCWQRCDRRCCRCSAMRRRLPMSPMTWRSRPLCPPVPLADGRGGRRMGCSGGHTSRSLQWSDVHNVHQLLVVKARCVMCAA